jgi:hypothetical protein
LPEGKHAALACIFRRGGGIVGDGSFGPARQHRRGAPENPPRRSICAKLRELSRALDGAGIEIRPSSATIGNAEIISRRRADGIDGGPGDASAKRPTPTPAAVVRPLRRRASSAPEAGNETGRTGRPVG